MPAAALVVAFALTTLAAALPAHVASLPDAGTCLNMTHHINCNTGVHAARWDADC